MNRDHCENQWYNSTEFRHSYHGTQLVCIVGLLAAWELIEHYWIVGLVPAQQQIAHIVGVTLWLSVAGVLFYKMVLCYQHRLEALNDQLQKRNDVLYALEAARDKWLVQLSQELSLCLAEIISRHEVALQTTTNPDAARELTNAIGHAHGMFAIARELIELKRHSVGAVTLPKPAPLPATRLQRAACSPMKPVAKPTARRAVARKKIYARV